HGSAVGDGLLRVEGAFAAGESLDNQSCVFIYQYAHSFPRARRLPGGQFDYFLRRVQHVHADREIEAGFQEDLASEFDVRALHADDDGHLDVEVASRADNSTGQRVAAQNAAEDVDQDRLHIAIREQDAEGVFDLFGASAAADVEEVGRRSAGELDD